MWTNRYSLWERAAFDPLTLTAAGLSIAGGALTAGGALGRLPTPASAPFTLISTNSNILTDTKGV
jgi:hypothetical protein